MTTNKGFSHVGYATHDLEGTIKFYRDVLGFPVIALDTMNIKEGGKVKHILFDCGRDQLLAFMAPIGVDAFAPDFDAALGRKGVGVPGGVYHISFEGGSNAGLEARREHLLNHGIEVSPLYPHAWASSIYFKDPVNGLQLEFCCWTREWTRDDAEKGDTFEISVEQLA